MTHKITQEDIMNCWSQYYLLYLADILNGDYDLREAKEDIFSLIGSKWDSRTWTR